VQRSSDYHVIVASRVRANGEKVVAELQAESPKGSLSCLHLDVTDNKSIQSAAASVEKDFGRLDVLVNNAGMSPTRIDGDLRERLMTIMNTNALGAVMVTEVFKELLFKSKNPRLIYVSSGLGSLSKASDPNDLGAFTTSYPYQV
jgi:NAD(P)-dependent dehydrogenase (short-subunit alcohol dehydrogenase family)